VLFTQYSLFSSGVVVNHSACMLSQLNCAPLFISLVDREENMFKALSSAFSSCTLVVSSVNCLAFIASAIVGITFVAIKK